MSARSSPQKNSPPDSPKKSSARKAKRVIEIKPLFDPRTHDGPLPTPCNGVCVMDGHSGFCKGCQRSLDEIVEWGAASESRKRQVWIAIESRRTAQ